MALRAAVCLSGFARGLGAAKAGLLRWVQGGHAGVRVDVFLHTYAENLYEFSSGKADELHTEASLRALASGVNLVGVAVERRADGLAQSAAAVERLMASTALCGGDGISRNNHGATVPESSAPGCKHVTLSYRIYDQLRKVRLCHDLAMAHAARHGFAYDLVLKARPEVLFLAAPDWQGALAAAKQSSVLVGAGAIGPHLVDDIVALSTPALMAAYAGRAADLDTGRIHRLCAHLSVVDALNSRGISARGTAAPYALLRGDARVHIPGQGTHPLAAHAGAAAALAAPAPAPAPLPPLPPPPPPPPPPLPAPPPPPQPVAPARPASQPVAAPPPPARPPAPAAPPPLPSHAPAAPPAAAPARLASVLRAQSAARAFAQRPSARAAGGVGRPVPRRPVARPPVFAPPARQPPAFGEAPARPVAPRARPPVPVRPRAGRIPVYRPRKAVRMRRHRK